MTIEQLMAQVGAPSVKALEAKLVEFDLTLADCEGSKTYRQDLTNIFASGLAVVGGGAVATTETPKEAPIAPTKKKSSRLTKAQRLEMTKGQQSAVSATTDSALTIEMGRQVAETKDVAIGIDQFTTELAEYQGDLIVGMESSIATKLTAYLNEAGDVGRIGLGSMVKNAATSALDDMYASLAE